MHQMELPPPSTAVLEQNELQAKRPRSQVVGPLPVTWSHTARPDPDAKVFPQRNLMEEEEAQISLPGTDWKQI